MKVLIPGIAGGLARRVAKELLSRGHEVAGLDARPWADPPRGIAVYRLDLRKRAAEDLFRKFRPDAVIHMATVTSLVVRGAERSRINLGGTEAVYRHCQTYGVKHAVFVGRHTYYGAGPDSALYHQESEPPVELGRFPELADLVAADLMAASALWRVPEMRSCVLRLCYTLGPSGHGTLAGFLKGSRVPMVLGFDPLFQFLHDEDAVAAICAALDSPLKGIFNVAGPQPVPLSLMARIVGRPTLPLPERLLTAILGRAGIPDLPRGALTHLKFPVVVDARPFHAATGFKHRYDEIATLEDFAHRFPGRI